MNLSLLLLDDSWVIRLIINHVGYVSLAIPIGILFLISEKATHVRWPKPLRRIINPLIRLVIFDNSNVDVDPRQMFLPDAVQASSPTISKSENFTRHRCLKLIVSFFGLQISYLLWGLLQERIMTKNYADEKFTNSQYLVFVNRALATIIAYVLLRVCYSTNKSVSKRPPLSCYGIISYTNCMATWFQYESLLYISFPLQVIAKSIKTIPVMLVGRFVSGKTYPIKQYILMLTMAVGITFFLIGYQESKSSPLALKKSSRTLPEITTLNGIILLIGYLGFDAFTSNYQKQVFDRYSISFLNMMFFVNLISTIITLVSLLFNGTLWACLAFMQRHQSFALHVLATSICSSVGQLFIFSTIEEFGPVIFTIIMTVRQAFSILLSCIVYGHHLNWLSILGIHIAFLAIFIHAIIQFKRSKQSTTSTV